MFNVLISGNMTRISIIDGDIGHEGRFSDAIINAANENLHVGEGVAKAIGLGCGRPILQADCDEFIKEIKKQHKMAKVPTGSVAITGAYGMAPAQGIGIGEIHT